MNTTNVLSVGKRKLSTRALALIGVSAFALTIALIYLQENVRGKLAWDAYKNRSEAKGKSLDWAKHIPPEVEEDLNIYKAPGMRGMIKSEGRNPRKSLGAGNGQITQIEPQSPVANYVVARVDPVTNHIVAQVYILEADRTAPADALQVASVNEIATALAKRGRILSGASGIRLCNANLIKPVPLKFGLKSSNDIFKQLQSDLKDFGVRNTDVNRIEVYIDTVYTAEEYLKAYESQKTHFDQLATALKRPYARMDGDYTNPAFVPIQNFVVLRTIAQTLGQVAQSYILLSKPQEALQALTLMHEMERLITALPSSKVPTVIASMINVAIKGLYVAIIADGQDLGVWGEADMVLLQKQFEQVDLIPLVRRSLEFERIAVSNASQMTPLDDIFMMSGSIKNTSPSQTQSFFRKLVYNPLTTLKESMHPENAKRHLYRSLPKGWLLQNVVRYCELMEEQIAAFSLGAPGVRPTAIDDQSEKLLKQIDRFSPYIYLARTAIPNFQKAMKTATLQQTMIQLANVSLALERYHLATGKYPETLESLSPSYLKTVPLDLITGAPPIYRLTENGSYLLYGLGWNEKDDGGQGGNNVMSSDWVWNPERN